MGKPDMRIGASSRDVHFCTQDPPFGRINSINGSKSLEFFNPAVCNPLVATAGPKVHVSAALSITHTYEGTLLGEATDRQH
eukprot:2736423-Rhodomonas_salina.1